MNLKLSISKIRFDITPVGTLFPLICFNETKELKRMGIDTICLLDHSIVSDMKLGKGAILNVSFGSRKEGFPPEIKNLVKGAIKPSEIPLECPKCRATLNYAEKVVSCLNRFCSGQSKGMLFRLFNLIDQNITVDEIDLFLNNYVSSETTCTIDNIEEFKLLFTQLKEKKTQARESAWIRQFPNKGRRLWEIELTLDKFLKQVELNTSIFWAVCNFPLISKKDIIEMNKINPKELLNLEIDLKKMNLSKKVTRYFSNNVIFINFLNNFFEEFGEKKWIT